MNIDDLTIRQARELAAMFSGCEAPKAQQSHFGDSCHVIVCTDKRGVVFGLTENTNARPITLTEARMCLYWSADVGGVFGLAENGPTKDCKISAVAPSITLEGVTAIFTVDEKAVKAWKSAEVQGR